VGSPSLRIVKEFTIDGQEFRLFGGIKSTVNQVHDFIKTLYANVEIFTVPGDAPPGLQTIIPPNARQFTVRVNYHNRDRNKTRRIIFMHEDEWLDYCKLRSNIIAMIRRLHARGIDCGSYDPDRVGWLYHGRELEEVFPWRLYDICKWLIGLLAEDRPIIGSVIQQIFPRKSARTYVACNRSNYKIISYWDIHSAYGQIARRIGDCEVWANSPRAIAWRAGTGRTYAIHEGWHLMVGEDFGRAGPIWDELERKELKKLRLNLIGAAMTQIRGESNYIGVSRRKSDGVIGSHIVPMRLKPFGKYVYTAALAMEFIREAMMLEYELAGNLGAAALTDAIMVQGDYRPFLWDRLGLDYRLKHRGEGQILAPNCYRIGDHTSLNFGDNAPHYEIGEANDGLTSDRAEDGRIIAIPIVMGWSAHETIEILNDVASEWRRRRREWDLVSDMIHPMPEWLAEIQDRRAEKII
jgi:hypothetical protein